MKRLATSIFMLCIAGALSLNARPAVKSYLSIYDLESGKTTVVTESRHVLEAPNWTPDGRELVYNEGGKIFRIPVEGGEPVQLPTGSARDCNNDHVISADGKWIAISNNDKGIGSRIYIVPFPEGGEPKLVTEHAPSYLHGWTSDRKTLIFAGGRGKFKSMDIYAIDSDGTNERRLTDTETLNDGSEFSPDNKTIWFNSVRTGLMQVWKMEAGGGGQTQMTFDKTRNAWFPHISPDGQKLIYIAYRAGDVEPADHPANKNVEILLMPAAGGEARVLVSFLGGQGSINVNSWSPDSKRFAYVSYELVKQEP